MTHLWFWRYTLRSRSALNARTGAVSHEGALIRDFGGGVGCMHPWPSLGDAPLGEQLRALAVDQPTALGLQALRCAEADGLARREGRRLFDPLTVPPSHYSAGPEPERDEPQVIASRGFGSVKFKGTPDLDSLQARLERWRRDAPGIRFRIDFNDTLSDSSLEEFWKELDGGTRSAIEFIEDPFPWNPDAWHRVREDLGIPLAADRELEDRAGEADWLVVKPAVINSVVAGEIAHEGGLRLAFTSYLDHAIGQLYAAWRAAECAPIFGTQLGDCGLLTHECFEPDPFFEQLQSDGPRLVPPAGTGLGFDELLEGLPWKPLN